MPVPYDLYIRFLSTKGVDDIGQINDCLKVLNLLPITQTDLDGHWDLIHKALPVSAVSQIEEKTYAEGFLQSMRVLEVSDLWLYEPSFKSEDGAKEIAPYLRFVYEIHQDTWLRANINALMIKKVSLEEIARILSSKFSVAIKERHLDLYARFFFNTSRMTRSAWKSYIKRYTGKEAHIYFVALTENVEVLKTELDLPAIVNVSDGLQWLLTKSMLKARAFINMETMDANREAREWIDQVVKLTDKYEKHRSGDQHDFGKALQMEFEFVDEEFGTPDDTIAQEISEKNAPKEAK